MERWHKSSLGRAIMVLSRTDQRKVIAVTILQIFMGGLDLLGVIAIGLLGALSVTGLQSAKPGDRVEAALRVLQIQDETFQNQAVILGISAVVLLVGRTILSIFFTRRILFFLSRRGAKISADLISRLLSQPLIIVQSRTTQETVYAVAGGVQIIVLQVLATMVVWISDLALLVVMFAGLLAVDPITAISTFFVFCLLGTFYISLCTYGPGL